MGEKLNDMLTLELAYSCARPFPHPESKHH